MSSTNRSWYCAKSSAADTSSLLPKASADAPRRLPGSALRALQTSSVGTDSKKRGSELLYTTKIGCIVDLRQADGIGLAGGTRHGHAPETFPRHPGEHHDATSRGAHPLEKSRTAQRTPFDGHQSAAPSGTGDAPRSLYRPSGGTHRAEGPSWDDCLSSVRALSGDA